MASEIIRRRKTLQHYLTEDDINPLPSYQQTTGQWRFNEGMVTCEAPKGSKSPTKDNELSASGSRTSGHSALSQIHSGHYNKWWGAVHHINTFTCKIDKAVSNGISPFLIFQEITSWITCICRVINDKDTI